MTVAGEWFPPALSFTHELFIVVSLPCPAEERSDKAALVGNQGQTPTTTYLNVFSKKTALNSIMICLL